MSVYIQQSIFAEIAEFLVAQPSLEAIAAYQVSPGIQQHIDSLLDKQQEAGLTADERLELEKILAVAGLMNLAKAKAKLKLRTT
jgi:hypothetical protein